MKFGGDWSDDKLDALGKYLSAYTTALKRTGFNLIYIDAFAGAGQHRVESAATTPEDDLLATQIDVDREIQGFRHGSPLIALETTPPFAHFIFIEKCESSMGLLIEQVSETIPHKEGRVEFRCGDANAELLKIASMDWKPNRAVAFLDPFALQLRWETIEAIAHTQAIDMWLLFPAMAVNRMLPRSGNVPEAWAAKLDETFGDRGWRDVFYLTERDLFDQEIVTKTTESFEKLSKYVTSRLSSVFSEANKKPLLLRNSTGSPIFLLCFASGNPRGARIAVGIAQHIINKKSHGH